VHIDKATTLFFITEILRTAQKTPTRLVSSGLDVSAVDDPAAEGAAFVQCLQTPPIKTYLCGSE
jgi:hypothetical protein